ncbi:MAG TPA: hypothetical protein VKU19_34935 [Bryobacteraceae bacterium]|nr:hypothetical protein [Bryobacteraceae bacterium]
MSRRTGAVLFALLAVLFLAVNRNAYRGYFQDDELDTLSWARYGSAADYLKAAVSPRFQENNFRPAGHFYFHESAQLFGLDFPKYVAGIHLLHLLNVWLVWMLARSLAASPLAAGLGAAFFAFHMALFDAVWKPMYVFDVLCATFCLASLLLYARQRWVWSFVAFWMAYKSKELAVMLPIVLACYEIWFGKRRWRPLLVFFAAAFSFGLQGLLFNPNRDNEYTFRFTLTALAKTSVYYAGRVFLVPYLGFVLPLAALHRGRRVWFGLAMAGLFFFPLLFLPGRVFAAYCYLPFTGIAIALTGLAEGVRPVWIGLLVLAWIPLEVHSLRVQERATLARDRDVREWVTTVEAFAKSNPAIDGVVADGAPDGFARWGVEGALKYVFNQYDLKVSYAGDPEAAAMEKSGKVVLLHWDEGHHRLEVRGANTPVCRVETLLDAFRGSTRLTGHTKVST